MKKVIMVWIGLFVAVTATQASFKMPSAVYPLSELSDAQEKAKKKGFPITFIFTRTDSNCPYTEESSLQAASRLRGKSILVYAEESEKSELPQIIRMELNKIGNYYWPLTVVVDTEMKEVIAVIPTKNDVGAQKKLLDKARKKISKMQKK